MVLKKELKWVYKEKLLLSTFFGSAKDIINKIRDPVLKEVFELNKKKK